MTREDALFAILILGVTVFVLAAIGYSILEDQIKSKLRKHIEEDVAPSRGALLCKCILGYALLLPLIMLSGITNYEIPPPIKLIFLDIDGVLNHSKATNLVEGTTYRYDPECVERLNELIKTHRAKLVVCSAWRIGQDVNSMQNIINSIGVKGEVIGLTPDLVDDCYTRDDEIETWLNNYSLLNDVKAMILIDDDQSHRFSPFQVKPSWEKGGFSSGHLAKAIHLLSDVPANISLEKVNKICRSETNDAMNFGGQHIPKTPSRKLKPH
jgi:hypothetical protein